jgi:prefoldin subunit 5
MCEDSNYIENLINEIKILKSENDELKTEINYLNSMINNLSINQSTNDLGFC